MSLRHTGCHTHHVAGGHGAWSACGPSVLGPAPQLKPSASLARGSREGRPLNMHKSRSSLGNGKIQMQGRVKCRKETQAGVANPWQSKEGKGRSRPGQGAQGSVSLRSGSASCLDDSRQSSGRVEQYCISGGTEVTVQRVSDPQPPEQRCIRMLLHSTLRKATSDQEFGVIATEGHTSTSCMCPTTLLHCYMAA